MDRTSSITTNTSAKRLSTTLQTNIYRRQKLDPQFDHQCYTTRLTFARIFKFEKKRQCESLLSVECLTAHLLKLYN